MTRSLTRRRLLAAAPLALAAPARLRAAPVVHVSYVLRPFNVPQIVMRRRGLLERRLQPLGWGVAWHDITSGVLQAQALAAGSLDIGAVMNPVSVILALANGNPLRIIGGFARNSKLAAILAVDPAIRTVADLKGRMVAGLKGAAPHELLIKALQAAGLGIRDVTFLDMDLAPSYTALLSRRVDAAVLAADLILTALHAGAHEVPTAPGLIQPVNTACARAALVARRPDLVRLYQAAQQEAVAIVAADPEAAIRLGCEVNGLDVADGHELYRWQQFITGLTEADLQSLERDMRFLIEVGLCPRQVDLRAATFEAMAT
jgi:ABC-type nitrate/sulfonate/bicarbonate transport system substrate-binding protein